LVDQREYAAAIPGMACHAHKTVDGVTLMVLLTADC